MTKTSLAAASAAIGFALLLAPAWAAPRTINDCEKIEAADAYNQCLALFGPPGHVTGLSEQDEPAGGKSVPQEASSEPQDSSGPQQRASGRHNRRAGRHYAHHWLRHRHHSASMEFTLARKQN